MYLDLCSSKWISVCVEKYLAQYSSTGVPWNPSVPQNMYRIFGTIRRTGLQGALNEAKLR